MNKLAMGALALSFLAGCAAPGGIHDSRVEHRTLSSLGGGETKPTWTKVVMLATVARIDWRDLDWDHVEVPGGGYFRERKGGDVDVVVTLLDGKSSNYRIPKDGRVLAVRGELRLP